MDSSPAPEFFYDAQDLVDDVDDIHQFLVDLPSQDDHPNISLHVLTRATTPQTMWVKDFLKNIPLTILINSGSTHNFIDHRITKHDNYYVHPCSIFEVMISNGGTLPCKGKCHNVCISIGFYNLRSDTFSFP